MLLTVQLWQPSIIPDISYAGTKHCAKFCPGFELLLSLASHVQVNKFDWLVFNAAWLGVIFAGVEKGLAIAIGLSVLIVLYKTGFPHLAVLGRLPGTTVYRYSLLFLPVVIGSGVCKVVGKTSMQT